MGDHAVVIVGYGTDVDGQGASQGLCYTYARSSGGHGDGRGETVAGFRVSAPSNEPYK